MAYKRTVTISKGFYLNFWLGLILWMSAVSCEFSSSKEIIENPPVQQITEKEDSTESTDRYIFNIPIGNKQVVEGKVKWNESLAKILEKYNATPFDATILEKQLSSAYDLRKLRAGQTYTLLFESDTIGQPHVTHLIFEPDAGSLVTFFFEDSIYGSKTEHPRERVERTIAATIQSSVYEAVLEAGGSPILVNSLVDILAWQVDFFRIQKGDRFKVFYEEIYINGKPIGVGKIYGVEFQHIGKTYYGFQFEKEGTTDYFDNQGNSLRKEFLRSPLQYKRISSRYSPKRFHPVLKRYKAHLGTDYAADPGTPIRTVGEGVVLEATYHQYNGNYVKIKHNANYTTQYLHMQKIKAGIRPGVKVKQGEIIGFVGSTGLANGPHLCFRFWKNGVQVDALTVDLPPTEPIKGNYLHTFLHSKNIVLHRLNQVSF